MILEWLDVLRGFGVGYLMVGCYLVGRLHEAGLPHAVLKDAAVAATWPVTYPMGRARLITASCPCARNRNRAHPCEVTR